MSFSLHRQFHGTRFPCPILVLLVCCGRGAGRGKLFPLDTRRGKGGEKKSLKDPRSWPGLATLFFSPNFHTSLNQKSLKTQKPVLHPLTAQRFNRYNSSLVTHSPRQQGLWSLARSLEGL